MNKQLTPEAMAWAKTQNFSPFVSRETVRLAYEAHQRIMQKIAARKAKAN